jgi:hypothetical protein
MVGLFQPACTRASANQSVGGWSTYNSEITDEATEVFETVTQGLVGVSYEPVAFATQVVAGTNYSFFCNAKAVVPSAPNKAVLIDIYQPLEGSAHITHIRTIEH